MCARARRVPGQRAKSRIGPRSAAGAAALRAGGKGHRAGVELRRVPALRLARKGSYFARSGISVVSGASEPASRMWRVWELSCKPPLR